MHPPHRQPSQPAESERRDAEPTEATYLRLARELLQFRPAPDAMDAWLDRIAELVHNAAPVASQQQREPSRARQPSCGQERPRGAAPPPPQGGNFAGRLSVAPPPPLQPPRENQ